jgi:hypothetical protein
MVKISAWRKVNRVLIHSLSAGLLRCINTSAYRSADVTQVMTGLQAVPTGYERHCRNKQIHLSSPPRDKSFWEEPVTHLL